MQRYTSKYIVIAITITIAILILIVMVMIMVTVIVYKVVNTDIIKLGNTNWLYEGKCLEKIHIRQEQTYISLLVTESTYFGKSVALNNSDLC